MASLKLSMFNNAVQVHFPATASNEMKEKHVENTDYQEITNDKFDYFLESVHSKGVQYIKFLNSYNIVQDVSYTIHNEFSTAFWYKVVKIDGVNLENSRNGISIAKPITRQDEARVYDDVIKLAKDILGAIVKKYIGTYERGNFLRTIDTLYNDLNEADNGERKSIQRLRIVTTHKRDFRQYVSHILSIIEGINISLLPKFVLSAIIEFGKLNLTNIVSDSCENDLKNEITKEVDAKDVARIREDIHLINDTLHGVTNVQYKHVIDTINNNTKINKDWDKYESALKEWISGKRKDIKYIIKKWYRYIINETVGRWDDKTKFYITNEVETLVHDAVTGMYYTTVPTINVTSI